MPGPFGTRRVPGPIGFWDGVRRVLPSVRAAMEFCWLYPWLVVLGGGFYGPTGPLLGAGWALALLVGAQAAVRPVLDRWGALGQARAILVGAGAVVGFLAVHAQHYPEVPAWDPAWIAALLTSAHDALPAVPKPALGALVAACLWWRGLALGTRDAGAMEIEQAYKTGVAAIVLYFVAAAIYPEARGFQAAGAALPGTLPAFFFLGLSALAIARLGTIWDRGRPDERAHFPARAWLLVITGMVGLILLAASTTAGLAAADVSTYLGLALRPLLPVLEVLFLVLFFIAGIIVRVLLAVLSRLPRRDLPEMRTPPSAFDDLLRRLRELEVHPQLIEGVRWGMVLAVLLVLVAGMALTIVLMRRRERTPDEDERESVWSAREVLRGMAGLVSRWRRRTRDEETAGPAGAIRRIYREVLRLGADLGAPRPAWATPREHMPRLCDVLVGAADEVTWLTTAYERARYSAWHPGAAEVRAAEEALGRARAAVLPATAAPD